MMRNYVLSTLARDCYFTPCFTRSGKLTDEQVASVVESIECKLLGLDDLVAEMEVDMEHFDDQCDCCGLMGALRERLEGEERFLAVASVYNMVPQRLISRMVACVADARESVAARLFFVYILNAYFFGTLRRDEADAMLVRTRSAETPVAPRASPPR